MKLVAIKLVASDPLSRDNSRHRPRSTSTPTPPSALKSINVTMPRVTVTLPFDVFNQELGIWFASLHYPEYFTDGKIKPIDPVTLTSVGGVSVVDLDNTESFIRNYLRHVNRSIVVSGHYTTAELSKLPGDKIVVSNAGDILEGTSEIYSNYLADNYKEQKVDPYSQDYPRTIFVFNKHGKDIRVFMLNGLGYTFSELIVPSPVERINDLELFWNVLRMQPVKSIDVSSYLKMDDTETYDQIVDYHKRLLQLHREEQRLPFSCTNDEDLETLVSLDYRSGDSDTSENENCKFYQPMVNCKLYHHKDHGLLMTIGDGNLALVPLELLLEDLRMNNHQPRYFGPRF